jgi:hypothetical protein
MYVYCIYICIVAGDTIIRGKGYDPNDLVNPSTFLASFKPGHGFSQKYHNI